MFMQNILLAVAAFGISAAALAGKGGTPGISEEQAKAIALERVPGEVEEVELETEDGVLVYSVDVDGTDGKEWEVVINADSGVVVSVEEDDGDDDDDDDDDDDGSVRTVR